MRCLGPHAIGLVIDGLNAGISPTASIRSWVNVLRPAVLEVNWILKALNRHSCNKRIELVAWQQLSVGYPL